MFDPSFFELIVICVVALLVLGPDKLPGAIKTLGLWIGRLRRSFNNIKREIEQEVGADEIRRQLRNEAIMEKFNSTKNQVNKSIQSVKDEAEAVKNDLNLTSAIGEKTEPAGTGNKETDEEVDPIEKLATNDPTARVIPNKTDGQGAPTASATTPATEAPASAATTSPDKNTTPDNSQTASAENNTNTKDSQDKSGA